MKGHEETFGVMDYFTCGDGFVVVHISQNV